MASSLTFTIENAAACDTVFAGWKHHLKVERDEELTDAAKGGLPTAVTRHGLQRTLSIERLPEKVIGTF